jgi:hypothetical protein
MSLNLLPSEAKFQAQRMKIKAIINNFLWIIGGLWILLLVVTFGWWFFLNWRVGQLTKKYQVKQNDYKTMIDEVALTQKIKYQTKVVAKVLESRFKYGESMTMVNNLFSEDVKIKDVLIKENKSFEVSCEGDSRKAVDKVENIVSDINSGQISGFASAKLSKISVGSRGWSFTVNLFLK